MDSIAPSSNRKRTRPTRHSTADAATTHTTKDKPVQRAISPEQVVKLELESRSPPRALKSEACIVKHEDRPNRVQPPAHVAVKRQASVKHEDVQEESSPKKKKRAVVKIEGRIKSEHGPYPAFQNPSEAAIRAVHAELSRLHPEVIDGIRASNQSGTSVLFL